MHIFIDHNLPPIYAKTLDIYLADESGGHDRVVALRDIFDTNISDVDWMQNLSKRRSSHSENWCFLTQDLKLKRTKEERIIWLNSGLVGIFLKQSFLKQEMSMQLSKLFRVLPEIKTHVDHKSKFKNFEISAQANRLIPIKPN